MPRHELLHHALKDKHISLFLERQFLFLLAFYKGRLFKVNNHFVGDSFYVLILRSQVQRCRDEVPFYLCWPDLRQLVFLPSR